MKKNNYNKLLLIIILVVVYFSSGKKLYSQTDKNYFAEERIDTSKMYDYKELLLYDSRQNLIKNFSFEPSILNQSVLNSWSLIDSNLFYVSTQLGSLIIGDKAHIIYGFYFYQINDGFVEKQCYDQLHTVRVLDKGIKLNIIDNILTLSNDNKIIEEIPLKGIKMEKVVELFDKYSVQKNRSHHDCD